MRSPRRVGPGVAALIVPALALAAPAGGGDRVEAWREDVVHLVESIERMHPDPFFGTPREEFEAAVDALIGKLPELSDDQVQIELMRLVALLSREGRDGHTAVWPTGSPLLPVQLFHFSDGWFVVRAAPGHEELVGARLTALGDTPIEAVCERLAPLVTRDNDANLLAKLPLMMLSTATLHGLGLTDDPARATLALQLAGGEVREVELAGQAIPEYASWNRFPPQELPQSAVEQRWLRTDGPLFSAEVLEDGESLYVHYRGVQADDGRGTSLTDFSTELVRRFVADDLERVVIDVRANRGGNNTTFGPLIDALRSSPEIDREGRLFVLTGRQTFSAAGNFVTAIQQQTNALLVGEPTGGAPNQYGDAMQVALPNHSQVLVFVSTRYHEFGGPDDARLTHEPDLPVPYSSADYFEGRDPVLAAALAHGD